jgi:non-homologous end joining protein Ku
LVHNEPKEGGKVIDLLEALQASVKKAGGADSRSRSHAAKKRAPAKKAAKKATKANKVAKRTSAARKKAS